VSSLPLPLDGISVVGVEQAVAAPFATRQLADLGARVIKVERPGEGDFARGYDERVKGLASYFACGPARRTPRCSPTAASRRVTVGRGSSASRTNGSGFGSGVALLE
jgi:CoA-transferase family III